MRSNLRMIDITIIDRVFLRYDNYYALAVHELLT